jgi:hypothetical protein
MVASILISVVSLVLLSYWFRYSCLLLLRNQAQPAPQHHQHEGDLDPLRRALERDYQMLTYLCRHAAGLGEQSLEERILILDFKLMRLWYRLTRTLAPTQARNALSEMAAVVAFLGQRIGEQAGLQPEAR